MRPAVLTGKLNRLQNRSHFLTQANQQTFHNDDVKNKSVVTVTSSAKRVTVQTTVRLRQFRCQRLEINYLFLKCLSDVLIKFDHVQINFLFVKYHTGDSRVSLYFSEMKCKIFLNSKLFFVVQCCP